MSGFYCARCNSSPVVVCVESPARAFPVRDYDLALTLTCGQAFRWCSQDDSWIGVMRGRWVRLQQRQSTILAETTEPVRDWAWLTHYLQLDLDLESILHSFPGDPPMEAAVLACRGLRLLRQEPWECLASFLLSSTKQIVQIQQIIALLCERLGSPIPVPEGFPAAYAFPSPDQIARVSENTLRSCKMGFRAPFLLSAARQIVEGTLDLRELATLPLDAARAELLKLHGVGNKITDCVLLFAFGHPMAFPVDVWVMRALRELYFPRRRVTLRRLQNFAATHFGPNAGYAQQYLFHYARSQMQRIRPAK